MKPSVAVFAICLLSVITCCTGDRPPELGAREGKLAPCPNSPNCVSSQVQAGRYAIVPFSFAEEPDRAFSRLKQLLSMRRDTSVVHDSGDYFRVEFRTRLGFVDDGEFLLDRRNRMVHVRSASRLGWSDLGKNRSRLEEIRKAFMTVGAG